jgi:membrane protease YdiL (CAAX protease family)
MDYDDQHPPNPSQAPLPPAALPTTHPIADEPDAAAAEELQPAPDRERLPRVWTSFLVVAVSGISFLLASILLTMVAVLVVHGTVDIRVMGKADMLSSVLASRTGLVIMVILPQLALLTPAIAAAILSPLPARRRLLLVRGNWPWWTWFAAALATPLVGMISAVIVGLLMTESESLKELGTVFRDHGQNGFLIPLMLMIGLTPAVCEELVFRGYLQSRLTQSWGAFTGVVVSSALFATFHLDFVHVVAVFPLGLFLGWVTLQSGTLIPAMLGHFVNNALSVLMAVYGVDDGTEMAVNPALLALMAMVFGVGAAGLAVVCYASVTYRNPESSPLA